MGGEVVDAALDLFEQVGDVFVIKGQGAAQQRVQDDATAPHVYLGAGVQLPRDDLWEHRVLRIFSLRTDSNDPGMEQPKQWVSSWNAESGLFPNVCEQGAGCGLPVLL